MAALALRYLLFNNGSAFLTKGRNILRDIIETVTPDINNICVTDNTCKFWCGSILRINISQIVSYYIVYAILCALFRKQKNSSNIASHLISIFVCWNSVLLGSANGVISYYLYDLLLMIYKHDYLMIFHHIFTLYSLNSCQNDADHRLIYTSMFLLKTGDLFLHFAKLIEYLEYKDKKILLFQFYANSATLILWTIFRVILPFGIYPFHSWSFNLLGITFHIINVIWTFKMHRIVKKSWRKIQQMHDNAPISIKIM